MSKSRNQAAIPADYTDIQKSQPACPKTGTVYWLGKIIPFKDKDGYHSANTLTSMT